MNVIFLDIDGVLNCAKTKDRVPGTKLIGIDDAMVARLKQIADSADAKLVLTSSWKLTDDDQLEYLNKKLQDHGLKIYDKTTDRVENRGYGILQWASHHDVDRWIVLDDEEFRDYRPFGITNHLVKTFWGYGLRDKETKKAIEMLKGEE